MQDQTIEYMDRVVNGMVKLVGMVREDNDQVLATGDHIEVIRHYDHIRKATAQIKEARKALDEIEEKFSREFVPDVMRKHDVRNITIEGVGRVQISNKYSASIADKPKGYQWLMDNGHGALITETVNSSTLSAFAKNYMEEQGKELSPDDGFKVSTMTYTSITKAK